MFWSNEENEIIKNYAAIITGCKSGKKWRHKCSETAIRVKKLIERYGDDGYEDKPKDMNRVEYWISHLDQ